LFGYQLQKAAARAYARGFDTLTFVSELPKLINSLRNIISNLKAVYGKFRTKYLSLNEKDRLKKELFQEWLRSRYEWRTLLYDIQDLNDALVNFEGDRKIVSERQGTSVSGTENYTKNDTNVDFSFESTLTVHWEHSIRGAVSAQIVPPRFQVNPVVTAWELTRWSFIIDWVLDVGTALESLMFATFAAKYYGSYGIQTKVSFYETMSAEPLSTRVGSANMTLGGHLTKQAREPHAIPKLPQLTNRNLADSGDLILDLTALARTKFRF
jgi:hypothetical protein